jgi:Tol biopolymer transport system component
MDCKDDLPAAQPVTPFDILITYERILVNGEQPAVSPDGTKIAYTYNGDIFVMDTSVQITKWWDGQNYQYDTTGGKITQLTSGTEIDLLPRWHPDGVTVGFIRMNQGEVNKGEIYTASSISNMIEKISINHFVADSMILVSRSFQAGNVGVPIWDWSSDGKYVAFYSMVEGNIHLKVFSAFDCNNIINKKVNDRNISTTVLSFKWSSVSSDIYYTSNEVVKYGAIHRYDILNKTEIIDSSLAFPGWISQSRLFNRIICSGLNNKSETIIAETDLLTVYNIFKTSGNLGLKWSPNGNYIIFELPGSIGGPMGYHYSQIYIHHIGRNKSYKLTSEGDNNLHNYYFEWGNSSLEIYFERFKKINKIQFQFAE